MPRTVIFVGPSLYGVKVSSCSHELWRPPARQGDILSCVIDLKPRQIVLIDGVFHHAQSVWHRELLFALLRGVAVIGAASIGALRAAELWRYGMTGIGKIYEMYRDGEEDDSLVAMTFDPATSRPLRTAPIGQDQKQKDALAAIQFARSYRGKARTCVTVDCISPFYERVILSTLEKKYG